MVSVFCHYWTRMLDRSIQRMNEKENKNAPKKWIECRKHYYQRENDMVVVDKNDLFIIRINNLILQLMNVIIRID